jgi:hypothetical protein
MYRCLPNNKNIDSLKFKVSLAQGLMEKHGSGVPRPVYGRPSVEPPPKRLTVVTLLPYIWEILSLNVGWDSGYPDRVSSVPSVK